LDVQLNTPDRVYCYLLQEWTAALIYNISRDLTTVDDVAGQLSDEKGEFVKPRPRDKRICGSLIQGKAATIERLKADVTERMRNVPS
jgi:hypothetical protein